MKEIPNIFRLATKELSQDAFITWLLKWADAEFNIIDTGLNNCATEFVSELLGDFVNADYVINKVTAGRQWENIDIYAEINDEFLIIIEDKTFTEEHSDQLMTYKKNAIKWCEANNYKLVPIYLKTGSESDASFRKIANRTGYRVFPRRDLLKLLNRHKAITNNIFVDFSHNLNVLEHSYSSFENIDVTAWHGNSWVGFYQYLESQFNIINWHRVNNRSGGFWCAVLVWPTWHGFPVHLQIEEKKLCFKISFDSDDTGMDMDEFSPSEVQDTWQGRLLKAAGMQNLSEIKRPYPYVHRGEYRTVALVDRDDWMITDGSKIDKDSTVKNLRKYSSFLTKFVSSQNLTAPPKFTLNE